MEYNEKYYNSNYAQNTIKGTEQDVYGNAQGNQYDLAKDGSFMGRKIAVLQLYYGEGFDFHLPENAMKEKGFEIVRWQELPSLEDFKEELQNSSQFWLISTMNQILNSQYLEVITDFFNQGGGLFLWGDNAPFFADANYVSEHLFKTTMYDTGTWGDNVVSLQKANKGPGIKPNHPLTTGIEFLYEGITISTVKETKDVQPLMYGSASNLVTAYYDKDGKRAIMDSGFTRLFNKWDTAGTARFVKNCAAWLANVERFDKKSEINTEKTEDHESMLKKKRVIKSEKSIETSGKLKKK